VGRTLHGHRNELRLRAALDQLPDSRRHLSRLALELGYASHSHFTAAFRRRFGASPDWLRRHGTLRGVRRLLEAPATGAAA
jgi:AraC-like DNA-binding protein